MENCMCKCLLIRSHAEHRYLPSIMLTRSSVEHIWACSFINCSNYHYSTEPSLDLMFCWHAAWRLNLAFGQRRARWARGLVETEPKQLLSKALGVETHFFRVPVIHCPNSWLVSNGSHEEYGQLAARTSGHYFWGRHVMTILLCCFDFSSRHIVPQVAVKSPCADSAQKGQYFRICDGLKAYLDSPLFATYLRGFP